MVSERRLTRGAVGGPVPRVQRASAGRCRRTPPARPRRAGDLVVAIVEPGPAPSEEFVGQDQRDPDPHRSAPRRVLGVEPVAQPVGEHVESENREHDREAGEGDHPRSLDHEAAAVGQHQAERRRGRGTPTPRKDSAASIRIPIAINTEAWTSIGAAALGRMWVSTRRGTVAPSARAPSTYTSILVARTAARATRAMTGV